MTYYFWLGRDADRAVIAREQFEQAVRTGAYAASEYWFKDIVWEYPTEWSTELRFSGKGRMVVCDDTLDVLANLYATSGL